MDSSFSVGERLIDIRSRIPEGIELVAVSKFHPAEMIREAYDAGQTVFGESRVQELLEKIPLLPSDIKWHFIGHLQTNKVRQLIGKTALIESVDSIRLLELINYESARKDITTDVLMQVHVAREETKFGFLPEELIEYFETGRFEDLTNVQIRGLMAMASNTDDLEVVRNDFAEAASAFRRISGILGEARSEFNVLSMGMSGDWPLAVEEGATSIRIGSAIFGSRFELKINN